MKSKLSKKISKEVVLILNTFLYADANSASSWIMYQPKAPEEIKRFRRRDDKIMFRRNSEMVD